jgi:transposase
MSQVSKSSMNNLSASAIDSVGSNVLRSSTIAHSSEDRSPDPEVIEIATRRQFSASEKRMLLAEADRCKERGELGAFLRRKHIYSSMLSSWRKQLGVRAVNGFDGVIFTIDDGLATRVIVAFWPGSLSG